MDLSIVIVNYNTCEHLKSCLDSIYEFTKNIEFEIIIVDNNSPNRDIEDIKDFFPKLNLYLRSINDGFGAGCNYGAYKATGRHLAFVNPDVLINSNLLKEFSLILDKEPETAILAPVYIEKDGTKSFIYRQLPGYLSTIAEAFGSIWYNVYTHVVNKSKIIPEVPFSVEWVYGSFIFIKKDVFFEVNGFDEVFFLYYEDIDLQYRIRKRDYVIKYHPGYFIRHFERSSIRTYDGENLYYFHMTRSFLLYTYKHFGFFKRMTIRMIQLFGIILRTSSIPFRRDFAKKRIQKTRQYILKFRQYFYNEDRLKESKYSNIGNVNSKREQITYKDKFWKY